MQRWLLVRGRGDRPLPATGFTLERHASTRRPTVQRGDVAVCYASVWQAVFAVVEVVGDPEHDPERDRWAWSFPIRPLLALADLHDAPAAEEVGVFPSSIWRHSYIRLSEEQFAAARSAIARALVAEGYDAIADAYAAWDTDFPHEEWARRLLDLLPEGARVLELGCGNGEPVARLLAPRCDYTGVDVSRAQLALARARVPEARFVQADYAALDVEPSSLDAVVAILTITHVPREEHAALLERIRGWLRPGGLLLVTFGTADLPADHDPDWLGAPMFFSHFDEATNRRLLRDRGFEPLREEVPPALEDGVPVRFLWVLARLAA